MAYSVTGSRVFHDYSSSPRGQMSFDSNHPEILNDVDVLKQDQLTDHVEGIDEERANTAHVAKLSDSSQAETPEENDRVWKTIQEKAHNAGSDLHQTFR